MFLKTRRPIYLINMDIEITKREILFSIIIICVMLALGFLISGNIEAKLNDKYQEYNTATQIVNNADLFEYTIKTNVGNAFVYGDLTAVSPISIDDIEGKYSYIKRNKERYTRHSRTETYRAGGRTHTRIVYYWTWDLIERTEWHCKTIAFLGHEFPYNTIALPFPEYYGKQSCGYHLRYVYYICKPKYIGTLYTSINNHTIERPVFYNEYEIEDCIKYLESGWEKIVFWIFWIIIICVCVYIFYYLKNDWLERNKA